MSSVEPSRIVTISLRTLLVSFPLCALVLVAWATSLVYAQRPWLMMASFLLALMVSACAAMGLMFGLCHASIAEAFAVGVRTGQTMPPAPTRAPSLHVVE